MLILLLGLSSAYIITIVALNVNFQIALMNSYVSAKTEIPLISNSGTSSDIKKRLLSAEHNRKSKLLAI